MVSVMRSFIAKARRSRSAVAVIICDVDRFKSVNDRFGHGVGDDVLREVAARLSSVLREGDLIARVGGEEFLVALPNATMGDARGVAERLVSAIAARPFVIEGTAQQMITISAGLAISQPDLATPVDEIIDKAIIEADKAMLVSKTLGRNKITLARSAA
jgi:two-component system cell cycle response regulator